jgi:hypothetical protein
MAYFVSDPLSREAIKYQFASETVQRINHQERHPQSVFGAYCIVGSIPKTYYSSSTSKAQSLGSTI